MNVTIQETLDHSTNTLSTSSLLAPPVPFATKEELLEHDSRAPLKELSENKDQPEQEQEESGDVDKVNDYVAKVLEKLASQRNKIAKMGAMLDKNSKLLNSAQENDASATCDRSQEDKKSYECADVENIDVSVKENQSPVKERRAASKRSSILSVLSSPSVKEETSPNRIVPQISIEDVLQISRTSISYGMRLPGQIVEEGLEIVNNSDHDFVVQIFVNCKNQELADTEEYVFSVRRSHLYDYNDKHYLIMAPHSRADFKFALKIPNMKFSEKIYGEVDISVQGMNGNYQLNLTADPVIPKVSCPKALKLRGLDYKIVKLAVKEGKKSEFKIPLKNNGPVPVTMELEFYEPKDNQEKPAFDALVSSGVITIPPNGTGLANIVIRPYKGLKSADKPKSGRKILIGKVRDTAIVYSFVFWVETC